MPDREPFARLPDEIRLGLEEAAEVLHALDVAEAAADVGEREIVRSAIRLLTSKLWPELGGLLGDDEEYPDGDA